MRVAIACGLLGVLLTVAIAWSTALLTRRTHAVTVVVSTSAQGSWLWSKAFGVDALQWADPTQMRELRVPSENLGSPTVMDQAFGTVAARCTPMMTLTVSAGWPRRCLYWSLDTTAHVKGIELGGPPFRWTTVLNKSSSYTHDIPHLCQLVLPISPIWGGLAFNTAFFGVAITLSRQVVLGAHARWRARRALCVQCGYQLPRQGAAACPECGAAGQRLLS